MSGLRLSLIGPLLLTYLNPCLPLAKTLPTRQLLKAEDIIVK